ncbi:MAG TPA: response regulator, partial [Rectinemataceae bacterium]|nr:response regulator [Rectinemataceae bacterium]
MPGIAVVEDEYIVALDIRNFLERSGYSVVGVYASGDDLLANCEAIKPDLVLMDIKIRGSLDGVETARIVYERHRVPVVLLTAYADDETVARAKITHPFGYILKPFEERELRTAIEIALYRSSMEKRLRESEERYRRLFTEGISGNFLADSSGRVTEANPAFMRLMGILPGEALPHQESLFPERLAWESFREGLVGARRLELWELSLVDRGGREVHVLANAVALFDTEGRFTGIQGELTDTTERRKLEERLLQAQKMEAIGRLAGGVAHDFNNILTAVLGYANLLTDEIGDSKEARDDVEGIRNAAARAANLTRQLLAFSRRQPFAPKTFDLNTLIQDAERLLRRLLTEEIALNLELTAGPAWILADPVQIEQVLLNLAVNAKDSMPEGGDITIGTRIEVLEAPKTVGSDTLAPGGYALIEVRDDGEGIPPEIRDKIFEPFFTTKPKDRGTGLGHRPRQLVLREGLGEEAAAGLGV